MGLLLSALSSVRTLFDGKNLDFWRSSLTEYAMIWYFLLFCALGVLLSHIAIEILAPSQPPPAGTNVAQQQPPESASAQQAAAANVKSLETAPAEASLLEAMRQRLRALELQCDALRAEAQRSSRLEADLAAANIRIEQLTQRISSNKSVCTPCIPSAEPATAATPSFSDGTPLKFAHRTPSSASKSLTVRASVLQKTQTTPSVSLLQSR